MAYDNYLADRIDIILRKKTGDYTAKKMMGGLCYMVDDKMCIGIVGDQLMCRIGAENYEVALQKEHCSEMAFTGRPMKGYVFINANGIIIDSDLNYWVELCLAFNPFAKSSKKK